MASRDEVQAALNRDQHGYDNMMEGFDPEGPSFGADDPISRAGLTDLAIDLSVANGAALDLDLFSQAHLDEVGLPTGLVAVDGTATIAAYKKLLRYLQSNPMVITSINFASSEPGNQAPLMASFRVTPTRDNSFGSRWTNRKLIQSQQTPGDYQANRVIFPIVVPLDTITFLNLTTAVNGSGNPVTFTLSVFIGKRAEIRRLVPTGAMRPTATRPGGRGPVAV